MLSIETKCTTIQFNENDVAFEFKGYMDMKWDDNKCQKFVTEQWLYLPDNELHTVVKKYTYSAVVYKRMHIKPYGKNSKSDKLTSIADEVFMEWSPHLFKGAKMEFVSDYVSEFINDVSKLYPEKIIINNDIQPMSKVLPEGKTWWDINEDELNLVSIKTNNEPIQYYMDVDMITYVNKFKKVKPPRPLIWKNQDNNFITPTLNDDGSYTYTNNKKDNPYKLDSANNTNNYNNYNNNTNVNGTISEDGKYIPLHRRKNTNSILSSDMNSASFVPLHLRNKIDSVKFSIKLYNFSSLDGIEPCDILEWVRGYKIEGYIKIAMPKNKRTGKICSFAFLNFKSLNDKNTALAILQNNKLKFNHSIISVEDTSKDITDE